MLNPVHLKGLLVVVTASACLAACEQQAPPAPQVRPVRAVTVEHHTIAEPLTFVGQIKAQEEVSFAFRIDGRLIGRPVNVGDRISVGGLIARLEPQNEQDALRGAQADLASAQAALAQAERLEARQSELLKRSITSRASYDQALQLLETAQAQVEGAKARLQTAQSRVQYTELKADVSGVITAKGAEPGEVVRAGQMIVRVARLDRVDAVFEAPARAGYRIPYDPVVQVALTDDRSIKATGRVREMSPQADPVTRLFQVKVGLDDPPAGFFLGVTVTGTITLDSPPMMTVPVTAIIEADGKPSVWVVDSAANTVALRAVKILRYDPSVVIISSGLRDGEVVVTAGVNILYPGQKVRLLSGSS